MQNYGNMMLTSLQNMDDSGDGNNNNNDLLDEEPRLELLVQTSPFEEKVTRNGLQKLIRVVIKNSPFNVQLKLKKSDLDMNHVAFESTLLYDYDNSEEKEVDFVKCKPVEHKATPNELGDIINVELRIKVLTSQHEDMFFRVKVEGQDPITKEPIKGLYCLTNPIKVISKPEQLKKKQPPKKRTWNDILMESVSKIQHQQNEQQKLIEKLIDYNIKTSPGSLLNSTTNLLTNGGASSTLLSASGNILPGVMSNNNNNPSGGGGGLGKTEFEDSFKQMMNAYTLLDPRQRAEKVRRVFRNASSRDSETLSELLDLFITEGVGGPLGTIAPLPISPQQPTQITTNNNNNNLNSIQNMSQNSVNNSPLLHPQHHPHLQQHLHLSNQTTTTTTSSHGNSQSQPNPFLNQHNNNSNNQNNQSNQNNNNQNNQNNNSNNSNNNNGDYPFFSTIPTSFDNEFNSFGSGNNDFIPF